jgi:hypothetical protein
MNHAEEATKVAKDVRFSVLGRGIADSARAGDVVTLRRCVAEVTMLRQQEQDSADKQTRFAALARLIGDATRSGNDAKGYIESLKELRAIEIGPRPEPVLPS